MPVLFARLEIFKNPFAISAGFSPVSFSSWSPSLISIVTVRFAERVKLLSVLDAEDTSTGVEESGLISPYSGPHACRV